MLEGLIDFLQLSAAEDVTGKRQGEHGFDAAGAVGDDAECSGGSDRGDGGMANGPVEFVMPARLPPIGEYAPFAGKIDTGLVGLVVDELHEGGADFDAIVGIIRYGEIEEGVGEAHDAETDFSIVFTELIDLFDLIFVDFDDVIEKVDGEVDGAAEVGEVDAGKRFEIEGGGEDGALFGG